MINVITFLFRMIFKDSLLVNNIKRFKINITVFSRKIISALEKNIVIAVIDMIEPAYAQNIHIETVNNFTLFQFFYCSIHIFTGYIFSPLALPIFVKGQ